MSLQLLRKIIIFLSVNTLGFSVPSIIYWAGKLGGRFSLEDQATASLIQNELFGVTVVMWLVCALFSFAYFFLKDKTALFFLWSPVLFPTLYGLSVLL